MSCRPRLTVRARLTLLYTGLFAACGAVVVAVSYALVARLGATTQGQSGGRTASPAGSVSPSFEAQCRSEQRSAHPDRAILAKCASFVRQQSVRSLQQQGAQAQRDLTLSHLLQYSLITLAVVIALAAILGWIFAGRALRPVHLISAAARAASEHDLSARVAATGPRDELRELAETFDDMLGRLQAGFEGQQRFIANASHELRTPLAVMRATIDVVLGNPDAAPGDLRGMAADIRAAVDHAEHLISALLILARNQRGLTVREQVDLANTGPPTSPADVDRIFQPFQRLSDRTSHDGSGLGLAIVAPIAEIHGGAAAACPREDGGLSVTITIPSAGDQRPGRAAAAAG